MDQRARRLSHVARIRIIHQDRQSRRGDRWGGNPHFGREHLHEVLRQQRDILPPLPQGLKSSQLPFFRLLYPWAAQLGPPGYHRQPPTSEPPRSRRSHRLRHHPIHKLIHANPPLPAERIQPPPQSRLRVGRSEIGIYTAGFPLSSKGEHQSLRPGPVSEIDA